MAWSKAVDFYALSWGIPRKPACNLAETAQRKSQKIAGALSDIQTELNGIEQAEQQTSRGK